MFCPKCATQNLDGASFCRSCGANISLIPQALTGQLVRPNEEQSLTEEERCLTSGRRGRELTLETAFKNLFLGVAFLVIAYALARSIGAGWWFWMLIPAFMMMGTGIAQYIRLETGRIILSQRCRGPCDRLNSSCRLRQASLREPRATSAQRPSNTDDSDLCIRL